MKKIRNLQVKHLLRAYVCSSICTPPYCTMSPLFFPSFFFFFFLFFLFLFLFPFLFFLSNYWIGGIWVAFYFDFSKLSLERILAPYITYSVSIGLSILFCPVRCRNKKTMGGGHVSPYGHIKTVVPPLFEFCLTDMVTLRKE